MATRTLRKLLSGQNGGDEAQPMRKQMPRLGWSTIYHRGTIDDLLVEDVLRKLESALSQLEDGSDWAVVLYLLYAPGDRSAFNLWEVQPEIKRRLAEWFQDEAYRAIGRPNTLDEYTLDEWGYTLKMEEPDRPFHCFLKGDAGDASANHCADVDIYLAEAVPGLTAKGRFASLVRTLPIIPDSERLLGSVSLEGHGWVSPHVSISQRHASGRQSRVYLTERFTNVLAGPYIGCDLFVPSLQRPVWTDSEKLRSGASASRWPHVLKEKLADDAYLAFEFYGTDGPRSNEPHDFRELLHGRAGVHDFWLRVTGRVLPRALGEGSAGYGADWRELSSRAGRRVKVSVRLNEDGDAIAADGEDKILIWRNRSEVLEEIESNGLVIHIGDQDYRWERDTTETFYGSLCFCDRADQTRETRALKQRTSHVPADEPMVGMIARGSSLACGTSPLLPAYSSDDLVSWRGSILFYSDGKGKFEVGVAETSAHRDIFILERDKSWRRHEAVSGERQLLELPSPHEFIFGSSRYKVLSARSAYELRPHWFGDYQVVVTAASQKEGRLL